MKTRFSASVLAGLLVAFVLGFSAPAQAESVTPAESPQPVSVIPFWPWW